MDVYDEAKRSAVMRCVKGRNTKPEMVVRRLLHRLGHRFRLQRKDLPGKPDLVLAKWNAVIFVHGCFWHQHAGCSRTPRPTSNVEFWNKKLDRNVLRDAENFSALEAVGWRIFVAWECSVDKVEFEMEVLRFLNEPA